MLRRYFKIKKFKVIIFGPLKALRPLFKKSQSASGLNFNLKQCFLVIVQQVLIRCP
jgi:hypothetical protein